MVVTKKIKLDTRGWGDIKDITREITETLRDAGLADGTVTATTAGIGVIEMEHGLLDDYRAFWERAAPSDIDYAHHRGGMEDNGYSHVRATTLGPSLVVPFTDRHLTLGTWQRVAIMDFDTRPRSREIVLQIIGD